MLQQRVLPELKAERKAKKDAKDAGGSAEDSTAQDATSFMDGIKPDASPQSPNDDSNRDNTTDDLPF